MSFKPFALATLVASVGSSLTFAADVYNEFPVSVKNYQGSATSSVSYTGQAARQAIHNSLKKTIATGKGKQDAEQVAKLALYFEGKDVGEIVRSKFSEEELSVFDEDLMFSL